MNKHNKVTQIVFFDYNHHKDKYEIVVYRGQKTREYNIAKNSDSVMRIEMCELLRLQFVAMQVFPMVGYIRNEEK